MDAEEYKMKISRDWKAVVEYAWMKGFERGVAKCAKAAKLAGVAIELIIEAAGLTEEQINAL